jgi:hypothetical protein
MLWQCGHVTAKAGSSDFVKKSCLCPISFHPQKVPLNDVYAFINLTRDVSVSCLRIRLFLVTYTHEFGSALGYSLHRQSLEPLSCKCIRSSISFKGIVHSAVLAIAYAGVTCF